MGSRDHFGGRRRFYLSLVPQDISPEDRIPQQLRDHCFHAGLNVHIPAGRPTGEDPRLGRHYQWLYLAGRAVARAARLAKGVDRRRISASVVAADRRLVRCCSNARVQYYDRDKQRDVILLFSDLHTTSDDSEFTRDGSGRFGIRIAGKTGLFSADAHHKFARLDDAFSVVVDDRHLPGRDCK